MCKIIELSVRTHVNCYFRRTKKGKLARQVKTFKPKNTASLTGRDAERYRKITIFKQVLNFNSGVISTPKIYETLAYHAFTPSYKLKFNPPLLLGSLFH